MSTINKKSSDQVPGWRYVVYLYVAHTYVTCATYQYVARQAQKRTGTKYQVAGMYVRVNICSIRSIWWLVRTGTCQEGFSSLEHYTTRAVELKTKQAYRWLFVLFTNPSPRLPCVTFTDFVATYAPCLTGDDQSVTAIIVRTVYSYIGWERWKIKNRKKQKTSYICHTSKYLPKTLPQNVQD